MECFPVRWFIVGLVLTMILHFQLIAQLGSSDKCVLIGLRYCEKVYKRAGKNLFWSIKNSGEVLNKLKSRGFRATSLSTYDFSTLYTTLPHNLIKEKLINLIEWTFKKEGSPYIACNERQAFFTSEDTKRYKLWFCQNVCEALIYLLDNIYIRFGAKLYRKIVGIPMGTNCAPLVADLFLFCY